MTYRLTCMICGEHGDLVQLQEHAMQEHHYEQWDLQHSTKREIRHVDENGATNGGYIWTMPDGVDWLKAEHS